MEKGLTLKLRLFMFLMSASSACFGPFLPVYFNSRNLTYTEIGIAFAVSAIIGVVFQPLWGYISDKYFNKKRTLIIAISVNVAIMFAFVKANSFSVILTLIILNNIFMCAISPITDAYTFDVIEKLGNLRYSSFRVMSSAAWGVANLILGYVIKEYGINCSFIIYQVLALIGLVILFTMKFEGKRSIARIEFHDVKIIFKTHRNLVFLITIFLMNASIIAGVNYMNELVRFTKGDVSKLGMAWFVTCSFEVLTFFIVVRIIKKLGIVNVYLISIFIYGSKFIFDFLFKNADYIVAIQLFEGIAFTMFITSSLEYLNSNTEDKVRATAMSVYAASGGLGAFTSSLIGGMLLNIINPSQLYCVLGLICFLSLIIAFSMGKNKKTQNTIV